MDMPKSCRECDLRVIGSCNFCTGADGRKIDQMKIINNDIKPEWCPLRELPQKTDFRKAKTETVANWIEGYNACIDTILKEGAE